MWLFQCSECRECSMLRLVPLLVIIPAIVDRPAISIDRLVAKGTLGLLSARGSQWSGGGVGFVDRSSINRRGRHLRRRQAGLANERGREREREMGCSRIVCLTTSHQNALAPEAREVYGVGRTRNW